MDIDRCEISTKVDRMVAIKQEIEKLKAEQSQLEGFFLKISDKALEDTKRKTVDYKGSVSGKVTATMAQSLKIVYPSYLKKIFGESYSDVATEEQKVKLSAPAARLLTGLWTKDYVQMTIAQVIQQLPCDEESKKSLSKKLRGVKYETDRKYLMTLGGFGEEEAQQYAFFVSEAAVWENFQRLMSTTGNKSKEILELINGAVVVEEVPKITIESE